MQRKIGMDEGTPQTQSADGLFFEPPKQKATSSEEAEAPEKEAKGVNYKKRYDDLKKHYDTKVFTI